MLDTQTAFSGGRPREHLEAFSDAGFAVLDRFLAEHEVEQAERAMEHVVASRADVALRRPHNSLFPLRWNDPLVGLVLASEMRVSRVREAVRGRDLRWLSGYVTVKEPGSPPLWWHQDWWCWDHPVTFRRSAPQVAVLCYLCDTHRSNGALRVLPRSHRKNMPIHAHLPEAHGEVANTTQAGAGMEALDGEQTLAVRAGDAVVIDYRLLHGTHPNETSERRDCIHLSFVPSWKGLPYELRSHLISHPALPSPAERVPTGHAARPLLPFFEGARSSLSLSRTPPRHFSLDR